MIVDDLGRIPMSQHLAATLARAASYADAQQHPEVTLEHLLLALAEDSDAAGVLRSSNVDLARLAGEVSTHIGQIDARRDPNGPAQVLISHDLKRILEAAAAAARQGRRAEINGAIVLAAIVGDGKSTAAHLLRVQGLTFEQAIRALQRAAAAPPRPDPSPQPPPNVPPGAQQGSTEDILANARERVQSRSVQGQPNQGPAVQQGAPTVAQPAPMPPAPFQQPASPYAEPASPPRPEFRPEFGPEYRPEFRPDPQQRDPTQSPIAPQWEPANQMPPTPPRDVPVTQPTVRTGPPPGGPVQQPPPYQMPPQQRTQPPGLPPVPRQGGPAQGGGMMPPQPMPQGGPPPSLGQPQGRGQPPMPHTAAAATGRAARARRTSSATASACRSAGQRARRIRTARREHSAQNAHWRFDGRRSSRGPIGSEGYCGGIAGWGSGLSARGDRDEGHVGAAAVAGWWIFY